MAKSKKSDNASNTDENGSDIVKDADDSARDIVENQQENPESPEKTETDDSVDEAVNPDEVKSEDNQSEDARESDDNDVQDEDLQPSDPETIDQDAKDSDAEVPSDDALTDTPLEASTEETSSTDEAAENETVNEDELKSEADDETARATDETSESEPEEPVETPETTAPEPAERKAEPETKIIRETQIVKGSIWPGVFGGIIAAVVGFAAGRGEMLDTFLPESMQRPAIDMSAIDAVTEQAAVLAAQTEAQSARIDALEAAPDLAPAPAEGLSSDALDGVSAEVATLVERIAALEARPEVADTAGASDEALAALESVAALEATLAEQAERLAEQTARVAELTAAAETAEANAESEAARILARAALARVEVAVDSGEPYDTALASLEEVAPVEVPEPLRTAAEAGVPTLVELQASFPDAARVGLAAARAEVPESEVVGVTGFIRRQLNVRSTVPREGSGPDAVLSRAEAAVSAGDLELALTEMEALPDAARVAMNDWLDAASARKAAQDAARALADSLSSN